MNAVRLIGVPGLGAEQGWTHSAGCRRYVEADYARIFIYKRGLGIGKKKASWRRRRRRRKREKGGS
jgi:sarcosine oxidase delta subunit